MGSSFLKLAFDVATVLLFRGFGAISGFLLGVTVTHVVSVDQAACFFVAFSLMNVFGRIVCHGTPVALVRIVGSDFQNSWEVINQDLSAALRLTIRNSFWLAIALWLGSKIIAVHLFSKPELASTVAISGIPIFFWAICQVLGSAIQGKHEPKLASLIQNLFAPLLFVCLAPLFYLATELKTGSELVVLFSFCLMLTCFLGFFVWLRDKRAKIFVSATISDKTKVSLAPLFHLTLMDLVVRWSGYVVCSAMLSLTDVALFSAAQRTSMLISFVLIGVNLFIAPKFARAFAEKDYRGLNVLSLRASYLMILFSLPMLFAVLFFPTYIMAMFGPEYSQGAILLQIMAIGQFVNVLTGSVGCLLTMTGHESEYRQAIVSTVPIAFIGAILLTYFFGATGCATATAISVASQNLFANAMAVKSLGFNNLNIFRTIRQ